MFADPLRNLRILSGALLAAFVLPMGADARKFYDDDPVQKWPRPQHMEKVHRRKLSDYYDLLHHTFGKPGERHTKAKQIPAGAVNTLGEVPDSEWYTNRHYWRPMTSEELQRGPGADNAPDTSGTLTVVGAKTQGVTPGFTMQDQRGRRYLVKFDPKSNPEMTAAADVIASRFFHALGYNVPEYYVVTFVRQQIAVAPDATLTDAQGRRRPMTARDVTDMLLDIPRTRDGRYRAVASFFLKGKNAGEFRHYGTRRDDPNDTVPHEHRRDLRGYWVFCAWLNHDDSRAVNTLDMLVEEGGVQFLKHYLVDFGAALGSSTSRPNSPRAGNEYMFSWGPPLAQLFTLGLYVPRWARANFPDIPAVGRFEWEVFDPEKWVPEYFNPAFANCLPDDAFWAAKQVMAFTDDQIRAIVKTGQYSDPEAENWVTHCLIKRRDKIGRAFFAKALPLDRFAVQDGRLAFEDLEVKHGFISARDYTVEWFRFDNDTGLRIPLTLERTFALPQALQTAMPGEYYGAYILGADKKKLVIVYLRKQRDGVEAVGIDRMW